MRGQGASAGFLLVIKTSTAAEMFAAAVPKATGTGTKPTRGAPSLCLALDFKPAPSHIRRQQQQQPGLLGLKSALQQQLWHRLFKGSLWLHKQQQAPQGIRPEACVAGALRGWFCAPTPTRAISFCDFNDEMSEASHRCGGANSSSSSSQATKKATVVQKQTLRISSKLYEKIMLPSEAKAVITDQQLHCAACPVHMEPSAVLRSISVLQKNHGRRSLTAECFTRRPVNQVAFQMELCQREHKAGRNEGFYRICIYTNVSFFLFNLSCFFSAVWT